MLLGIRRIVDRFILLLAVAVVLTGCADDVPVASQPTLVGDEVLETAGNRSVIAAVTCEADVANGILSCGDVPVVDGETGLQRVVLGGQGLYVTLVSGPASYDGGNEIFQADVQVRNLLPQGLGSPDGLSTTGIRVFHHTGPTVTSSTGPGSVSVANADGTGSFTGSNQPYFSYEYYLPQYYSTPPQTWQWNVPAAVTGFEFTVFVDADVVGENGYVTMSPGSVLLATVGSTISVGGTPHDVVGRPVGGTVTYSSSDPSIATVDPGTGVVTAVAPGVVDIIGSTGGPEAEGRTKVTVAPPTDGFDIRLEFVTDATPEQQSIFATAAARWEGLITGDLPIELAQISQIYCGGAVDEYVDDLTIRVIIAPIDGPGGILGQAGPCWVRDGSLLPAFGIMQFDSDDTGFSSFPAVVLHEMGHVLGIGTLWEPLGLVSDSNGVVTDCFPVEGGPLATDPYFSGTQAIAAFDNVGGTDYANLKVPVENDFGQGTRCVHWRESVLGSELMTGFAEAGTMPLSELTVKSLADIGYSVASSGWDLFTCPDCAPPGPGAPPAIADSGDLRLLDDVLLLPIYTRDAQGRVIEVRSDRQQ